MTTLILAHGGTRGLLLELAVVIVPLIFIVGLALVVRRSVKPHDAADETEENG